MKINLSSGRPQWQCEHSEAFFWGLRSGDAVLLKNILLFLRADRATLRVAERLKDAFELS